MFICRQKGNATYFLLSMPWDLRLFYITVYVTNFLLLIELCMSDKLHKYQCCLLSFKQIRCGVRQCSITTHSLFMRDSRIDKSAYNDRLTHFLFVMHHGIIYLKSQWMISLTSCRLWDKITDHKRKYSSQTVVMRQHLRSMLVQCYLPTGINNIRSCQQEYGNN